MVKTLLNNKTKKFVAVILGLALVVSGVILTLNGTFASPNDIAVTLIQPNTYPTVEKGVSITVNASGTYSCASNDNSTATAAIISGKVTVTGVKAGLAAVAINSSVYTTIINYQITDSNNISAYTIKNGGQVLFSGPGSTQKSSPVVVTEGINNIVWSSLQPAVATVNSSTGAITGVSKGSAIIIGNFTDKWGVKQYIPILVGVGVSLDGTNLDDLINLINQGETILALDPNPYTPDSLADLQTAVDNGKAVLNSENPDDATVQKAIDDLTNALNNLEKKGPDDVIIGDDGNYYRPVGKPAHVWEKVDKDGKPTNQPPQYVYNPGNKPGNSNDKPAYPDNKGGYWVEDPAGSNIYKQVGDDGNMIDSPAIWGGPDGKFGGGDDETVVKQSDGNYWVNRGQNVWQKVTAPTTLGQLTGGGTDRNPATNPVTPIYDNTANDGRYYVGPLGPDGDGNMYYYGDPKTGGNGYLDSSATATGGDDVKYYKDANGNMTTTKPSNPVTGVTITNAPADIHKGDNYAFNATVQGTGVSQEIVWVVTSPVSNTYFVGNTLYVGSDETATSVTIRAMSTSDLTKYAEKTINVLNPLPSNVSVSLNPTNITYDIGSPAIQFNATVSGSNLVSGTDNNAVNWSITPNGGGATSTGASITNGSFTATAAGTYIVKATAKDDANAVATATVTVNNMPPPYTITGVKITNPKPIYVTRGSDLAFYAIVLGDNSPPQDVYWMYMGGTSSAGTTVTTTTNNVLHVGLNETSSTIQVRVAPVSENIGTSKIIDEVTVYVVDPVGSGPENVQVTINPPTATYTIGKSSSIQFNASVSGNNLASGTGNSAVTWTVSPTSGASITQTGSFNATTAGTYTITVTAKDDKSKTATATVNVSNQGPTNVSVTLSPNKATYTLGGSALQFTATVTGSNLVSGTGNNAVNWSVDKSGASITQSGSFTATQTGTYIVTVTAKDNSTKTATATVTVSNPGPTNVNVTLSPSSPTYTFGDSALQFTAKVTGNNLANGTGNSAVNWSISPNSGASISSSGSFTATTAGTYTITVKAKDDQSKTATATVTVKGATPKLQIFDNTGKEVIPGVSQFVSLSQSNYYFTILIDGKPANVNTCTWSSIDNSVGMFDDPNNPSHLRLIGKGDYGFTSVSVWITGQLDTRIQFYVYVQ
ncbi:MAG: Ig-like domain-containing protein [Oscillospiraceae bacterium]|nr:Ig-like domain-containing protein [Oscillospiraceae bacterium]